MKTNTFIKTFIMLLVSFTLVFFLNAYISNYRFPSMYIDENIDAVKTAILESQTQVLNGTPLENTALDDLSSETTFIRYQNFSITEEIGPNFIDEADIIDFVINMDSSEDAIKEGNLTYYVELIGDVYTINYIYEYEFGDWLIVSTKIQSLTNVDRVLTNLYTEQTIYIILTVIGISYLISRSIAKPLKQINTYAKRVSNLNFDEPLNLKRRDEFREINTSLNEMTFNLKKTYKELESLNDELAFDLDSEKQQEQKKKDLIMTINHEIKTPLAVIRGMVEGMIDQVGRFKDRDLYLQEVIKQIDLIESITKDLNYTLKLEDKKKENEVVHSKLLEDLVVRLKEFASTKKVTISSSIKLSDLQMSHELLEIVFTNIVKNSILYTEDQKVLIDTEILDDQYIITVSNKGHIEHEDTNKLFDSYTRGKNNEEGSGLGLYIVRQICNLYGYEYKIFNDNDRVVTKIKIKCH